MIIEEETYISIKSNKAAEDCRVYRSGTSGLTKQYVKQSRKVRDG